MKRESADITQASAAHIAKCRIRQIIALPSTPVFKRLAMQTALVKGGGVDEIAEILYSLGLRLSVDKNNPDHQQWIADGAVTLEDAE